jgi:hypothetical protein
LEFTGEQGRPPFRLSNIPSHLWIFLFGLPSSAAVGTSVLLMSPHLVYLCSVRQWDLTNKVIVVNVAIVFFDVSPCFPVNRLRAGRIPFLTRFFTVRVLVVDVFAYSSYQRIQGTGIHRDGDRRVPHSISPGDGCGPPARHALVMAALEPVASSLFPVILLIVF